MYNGHNLILYPGTPTPQVGGDRRVRNRVSFENYHRSKSQKTSYTFLSFLCFNTLILYMFMNRLPNPTHRGGGKRSKQAIMSIK